jgi:hypothetical protein
MTKVASAQTAHTLQLRRLGRFPGMRVLRWDGDRLFAGHGYVLWQWCPYAATGGWSRVAGCFPGLSRHLSSQLRLTSRLRRDGFHALELLPDGTLVAVIAKGIAVLRPGESTFRVTRKIHRGTRPLGLAATPDGAVYWGEYFDNARREAVHVYGSYDSGETWTVVHTFEAGAIRHVHNLVYDRAGDCLWVLTGDVGSECRIMRVSTDWRRVDLILQGSQQTRAVSLLAVSDGVYFATDTPHEPNCIYFMGRDDRLVKLADIAGSSLAGCQVGGALFFSTAVEPSRVNLHEQSCLYGSADGRRWAKLDEWRKDRWPARLFQYGRILLPTGENSTDVLAATTAALRGEDGVLHAWQVV